MFLPILRDLKDPDRKPIRSRSEKGRPGLDPLLSRQQRRAMIALAPVTVQCMPSRLSRALMVTLHPALTTPRRDTESLASEVGIAHPVSVAFEVAQTATGGVNGASIDGQRFEKVVEAPLVHLVVPLLGPMTGLVAVGAEDLLGSGSGPVHVEDASRVPEIGGSQQTCLFLQALRVQGARGRRRSGQRPGLGRGLRPATGLRHPCVLPGDS